MKVLIFDSGTLINLSMNGLLDVLKDLKKNFDGKFIVTDSVKYETVDRPIGIERFELGALRISNLINEGILETVKSLEVNNDEIKIRTKKFLEESNRTIQIRGSWVNIVSEAEMSCLALSSILTEKNIENLIAIDERTTRMLYENPGNLERVMSQKLHQKVTLVNEEFVLNNKFRFIRSSELVFAAYKKGLINLEGKNVLEALLYATKFKGSSISNEEIEILKKL